MTENLAERLLSDIAKQRKRITVIGDAIIDQWVHGHLEPSQDGCDKFVQESFFESPGGASNAYNCLTHWDVRSDIVCVSESDRCVKTRFVDQDNKIVFRWDQDRKCDTIKYAWAYALGLELVQCSDAVLLSDYDKGFLTTDYIKRVSDACKKRNIPCIADCKRSPEVYEGCILKGNEAWASKYAAEIDVYNGIIIITRGTLPPIVRDNRAK